MDKILNNTKFSYSRINTYDNCPQKYKIQYIDMVSSSNDSIEAYMGKRVHDVLEKLYSIKRLKHEYISFDRLMDMYNESWNRNWHNDIFVSRYKFDRSTYNKNTVYKNGLECLKNYYNRFNQSGYFKEDVHAVEFEFVVNIGSHTFRGFIDRVDKSKDGIISIIDYKTGSKPKGRIQAENDLQLAIYELAIKKKIKECKEIHLNLYYLRTDKILSFTHSQEKIDKIKENILNKVDNIKSTKEFIARESILCDWCYFWEQCDVKVASNPSIRLL